MLLPSLWLCVLFWKHFILHIRGRSLNPEKTFSNSWRVRQLVTCIVSEGMRRLNFPSGLVNPNGSGARKKDTKGLFQTKPCFLYFYSATDKMNNQVTFSNCWKFNVFLDVFLFGSNLIYIKMSQKPHIVLSFLYLFMPYVCDVLIKLVLKSWMQWVIHVD